MEKTLNTIIVLRNDHGVPTTKQFGADESDVILKAGEVGIHYLDNGNVIVKSGDGEKTWSELKQIEGVFEQPVTLTQNFGYYNDVPTGGFKTYEDTVGMTTSEFLLSALKKATNPTITQPNASLSASVDNSGAELEVGSYITKIKWNGSTSAGSYKVGSGSNQGTGLVGGDTWASNHSFTWAVSNTIDSQTSTSQDSSFTLSDANKQQITSTSSTVYATVEATVTLDLSKVTNPKNNLGEEVPDLKISTTSVKANSFNTVDGVTTKELSASASATGFHKPFWAVKAASADLKKPTAYTSSDVRSLAKSANSTKGFPSSLAVPVGSEQVVFFARAGAYSSLTATDDNAMNAGVTFTKVANALKVKGNNEYAPAGTDGFDYDLWYVDWNPDSAAGYTGIGSAKQLTLKWS